MDSPIAILRSEVSIIWDKSISSKLYNNGFFGKPLGLRKVKPGVDFSYPLVLSLFETLYLLKNNRISVILNDNNINAEQLLQYANNRYNGFSFKYDVYAELRDLGYIVRSGVKFGGDFIIYLKGPGLDHSKWVVQVEADEYTLTAINIVRAGRLAHSVKKNFLIAIKHKNGGHRYYGFSRIKI